MREVKKTKAGLYVEYTTRGVSSVVLRGKPDNWELALPNHKIDGAYWRKAKGVTDEELVGIIDCCESILHATREKK
jgi:hypothetical protein